MLGKSGLSGSFYEYGNFPPIMISFLSLGVLLFAFFRPIHEKIRKTVLFLVLFMIIGPGLIVNTVFKDNIGRPRPRQIERYGGKYEYVKPFFPGPTGKNSSFPSGHAAASFYLIFPYFLYRRENSRKALFFLASGCAYGFLMGGVRMGMGGHFASDVLWALGFVFLTGHFLAVKILE